MLLVRPRRRFTACLLLAAGALLGAAGCRRVGPAFRGAVVNVDALVPLHPGWARVRDLDRKLQTLTASLPPEPAALFAPPHPAQLQRVEIDIGRIDATQRIQLSELMRERVRRDFEAQTERLRRRAARGKQAAVATASAEAEARVARENERFAQEFDTTAQRYAQTIGRLTLRLLALLPSPEDRLLYPEAVLRQLDEERRRVDAELTAVREERDRELRRLQSVHVAAAVQVRNEAERQAIAAAEAALQRDLEALQEQRRRQQAELEREMAGTLVARPAPEPEPIREMPAQREQIVEQVARVNQAVERELQAQRAAVAAAAAELQRQRRQLASLIEGATRTAAEEIARERGIVLRFDGPRGDTQLTAWLAGQLRRRWGSSEPVTLGGRG